MNALRQRIKDLLKEVDSNESEVVHLDRSTFRSLADAYLSFEREELMRAQVAIREEAHQLELAEKVAGVGHWYWKVGEDHVIWSEQIFRIHGMEPDGHTVTLETALDAYHRDDREEVKDHLNKTIQTAEGFEFELRLVRPDGSVRYVLSRGLPELNEDGSVSALFGIFQDITERVQHERLQRSMRKMLQQEVQRRTRELRMANQELKDYAYIVSHDLRAPLINIIGFSKDLSHTATEVCNLLRDIMPQLPEDVGKRLLEHIEEDIPEAVEFIHKNGTKMDRLINSLLELSRLGSRIPRIEKVDLTALTQQIFESLSYQLEESGVVPTIGNLPKVEADAGYLEIIMNNLLSNAVKYLQPDKDGVVEVDCATEDGFATIAVRDNGCGIAEEDIEKIFLPFRRVGEHKVTGQGMGLAYVQMAVRQCGGEIQVASKPGKGSTFQFTIPLKPGLRHG